MINKGKRINIQAIITQPENTCWCPVEIIPKESPAYWMNPYIWHDFQGTVREAIRRVKIPIRTNLGDNRDWTQ